jgi:hypothetical protein
MVVAPEYSLQTQSKIPLALAALHNFIRINDPDDDAVHEDDHEDDGGHIQHEINLEHLGQQISQAERDRASAVQDEIAILMWADYERIIAEQGVV